MEIVEEEIESEQLANKKSMAWKELSARVFQAAGKDQRNEEVSQILERVRLWEKGIGRILGNLLFDDQ